MILRKPYAFLIKYFKIINLVISGLLIFLSYRSYKIITFFNDYINNNYTGNYYQGFFNNYITPFMFFVIILVLIGLIAITILLVYKKKPIKLLLFSIIYYIVFIVFLNIVKNTMITLETSVLSAEVSRIFRDVSIIIFIPNILFIILYLIRGLGININKFNFEADIKELDVKEEDSEEVEITFNNDGVKLKRNFRRFIREFGYYIKENKFIFIVLCILLIILIIFMLPRSLPDKEDLYYKQGDTFKVGVLESTIKDSIITNLDYKGNTFKDKNYYVVLKVEISNNTNEIINFDYNNFRLEIGNKYIYPSKDEGLYFIDYASYLENTYIKPNTKLLFNLPFAIKESEITKNYTLKAYNSISYTTNEGVFNYITITPIVINKVNLEKTENIGETLVFDDSNLHGISLTISNPLLLNRLKYKYQKCLNEKCIDYYDFINIDYNKPSTLLVFDYEFSIKMEDNNYYPAKDIRSLINNFVKVSYILEEEELYSSVENITPELLKNKVVLRVSNELLKAKEYYLIIGVRNKEYRFKLK